ncbi:MAG: efflux RND transporter permease subunit [Pirellulaceae bacterium]
MPGPTRRFNEFVIAWRYPLCLLGIALALAAYFPSQGIKFDRSIENMFSANDPILPPYLRLKQQFGGNEIVLAVYEDPELLHADGRGLKRLEATSERMKKVAGVKDVLSLAEVNALLERLQTTKKFTNIIGLGPKDDWKGPAVLNPQSDLARSYRELFQGYTHGSDGRTVALACMLEPQGASAEGEAAQDVSRRQTIEDLREIVTSLPDNLAPGVLAGEPVMVTEGFKLLEIDGQRLGLWSTLLVGLTIVVCFRSLRWLVVPIAVVQWTIFITQAVLALSGLRLSMVSSMLTAIVTVVGVATVVHLIVRYRELRAEGQQPREAYQTAATLLTWPIIGAIMTDVAGFGSLWISDVGPVKDFGTMMVLGSILVLPAVALLVPALALLGATGQEKQISHSTWAEGRLDMGLSQMVATVQKRSKLTALLTVLVSAVAGLGALRLEIESDFTRNFRPGSRVVTGYEYVETHLGGAGVWDVLIPAPDVLDEAYFLKVRNLETQLRGIKIEPKLTGGEAATLTKVISLVDILDASKKDAALAAVPTEMQVRGMAVVMPAFMGALQGKDEQGRRWLRIMLRARERQQAWQKRQLIDEVTRVAQAAFPPPADDAKDDNSAPAAEVTGFFVLLTRLIQSLLRDQWSSFAITVAGVAVMLLIAFRSIRWTLIALVPNALPILMVMGLLGWLGLKINMGAAMIAAVSMGLSVDSSIHYLAAYRRERVAGRSVSEALNLVQQSVGRAAVLSTLALIVGFMVLCTSEFVPTIYFGALVSLAMFGGLAGNLIVLPLLLHWTEK